jgi:hypothetical protein
MRNAVSIICIKCGDVSDACARLQNCEEEEEEEILFRFDGACNHKFGGGCCADEEEECLQPNFFWFFFPRTPLDRSIDLSRRARKYRSISSVVCSSLVSPPQQNF